MDAGFQPVLVPDQPIPIGQHVTPHCGLTRTSLLAPKNCLLDVGAMLVLLQPLVLVERQLKLEFGPNLGVMESPMLKFFCRAGLHEEDPGWRRCLGTGGERGDDNSRRTHDPRHYYSGSLTASDTARYYTSISSLLSDLTTRNFFMHMQ